MAISKSFTATIAGIATGLLAKASDIIKILDNTIHLEEWLGKDYTATENHNHDGTNSALVQGGEKSHGYDEPADASNNSTGAQTVTLKSWASVEVSSGQRLVVDASFRAVFTNSPNSVTVRIKFNGTTLREWSITGEQVVSVHAETTTAATGTVLVEMSGTNDPTPQDGFGFEDAAVSYSVIA